MVYTAACWQRHNFYSAWQLYKTKDFILGYWGGGSYNITQCLLMFYVTCMTGAEPGLLTSNSKFNSKALNFFFYSKLSSVEYCGPTSGPLWANPSLL